MVVGTDDIDNGMVLPKKEVCAKNSKDGSFGGGAYLVIERGFMAFLAFWLW